MKTDRICSQTPVFVFLRGKPCGTPAAISQTEILQIKILKCERLTDIKHLTDILQMYGNCPIYLYYYYYDYYYYYYHYFYYIETFAEITAFFFGMFAFFGIRVLSQK